MSTFEASDTSDAGKGDPCGLNGLSKGSGQGEWKCTHFIVMIANQTAQTSSMEKWPSTHSQMKSFFTPSIFMWIKLQVWMCGIY